ncbi:hypothetical protein [Paenibacillus soyae]|uniref:Uncharacterized protein n=1 Tax=Paenibacillus soyae TaxID=2969249 RepID=A0A9X2S9V6_9BACL|nr:hypothetical protein [Paenibacillus soyae]MCR2805864.1 hypothetical protein [Paenibacillus soyae]
MGYITIRELLELPIQISPNLNAPTGNIESQHLLIEEIWKGLHVGGLVWNDDYTIDNIESYERYTAIHGFFNGTLTWNGQKYEELTDEQKIVFQEYKLSHIQDNRTPAERMEAIKRYYKL